MKNKSYTIFETFVGAGGSHIGFKKHGFRSVYVNDFDKNFLKTLVYNNPEIKKTAYIDDSDIIAINNSKLFKKLGYRKNEIDVFFGGIVCKGFSLAGERSPNDERNYFYNKQLDLVKTFMPKISIIENVPGIKNAQVLSKNCPNDLKREINKVWQDLENFKGMKAELRKKNKISEQTIVLGKKLREKKIKIQNELLKKKYMISVLDDIEEIYKSLGYNIKIRALNAAWYGSATKRERIIIVATQKKLNGEFQFPKPQYFSNEIKTDISPFEIDVKSLKKARNLNYALKKINYEIDDIDNYSMNHAEKTIERFKYIPEGENIAKNIDKLPEHLKISKFYSRGNTMRLHRNKLCPTLVPGHSNFPVHPFLHRSITVREAATITGFPLDYKFFGSHTKRCEQVGNAVPIHLSSAIAHECKKLLNAQ